MAMVSTVRCGLSMVTLVFTIRHAFAFQAVVDCPLNRVVVFSLVCTITVPRITGWLTVLPGQPSSPPHYFKCGVPVLIAIAILKWGCYCLACFAVRDPYTVVCVTVYFVEPFDCICHEFDLLHSTHPLAVTIKGESAFVLAPYLVYTSGLIV